MRVQLAGTLILSAVSSERPGAVVEGTGYRHSNQSIEWRDMKFLVIPSKEHPHAPLIIIIVRIRLLKAWRDDESKEKFFFLYPEGDENRASCPIAAFLYLALEDAIFKDVKTIEEILFPAIAPTETHVLSIREEKERLPILRAETRTDSGWNISDTLALPYVIYLKFLKIFSLNEGFQG